jgi:hypothetical protein
MTYGWNLAMLTRIATGGLPRAGAAAWQPTQCCRPRRVSNFDLGCTVAMGDNTPCLRLQ